MSNYLSQIVSNTFGVNDAHYLKPFNSKWSFRRTLPTPDPFESNYESPDGSTLEVSSDVAINTPAYKQRTERKDRGDEIVKPVISEIKATHSKEIVDSNNQIKTRSENKTGSGEIMESVVDNRKSTSRKIETDNISKEEVQHDLSMSYSEQPIIKHLEKLIKSGEELASNERKIVTGKTKARENEYSLPRTSDKVEPYSELENKTKISHDLYPEDHKSEIDISEGKDKTTKTGKEGEDIIIRSVTRKELLINESKSIDPSKKIDHELTPISTSPLYTDHSSRQDTHIIIGNIKVEVVQAPDIKTNKPTQIIKPYKVTSPQSNQNRIKGGSDLKIKFGLGQL